MGIGTSAGEVNASLIGGISYLICGYFNKKNQVITTVTKTKLTAQMLAIFRETEASGEELIVTDHRNPVLKIVPLAVTKHTNEVFADARQRLAEQGVRYSAAELTECMGDSCADADWLDADAPFKPLDDVDAVPKQRALVPPLSPATKK